MLLKKFAEDLNNRARDLDKAKTIWDYTQGAFWNGAYYGYSGARALPQTELGSDFVFFQFNQLIRLAYED